MAERADRLRPVRVLVQAAAETWQSARADLGAFAVVLDQLADALDATR